MNKRITNLKFEYSKQKLKEKKLFMNSLSVNNINVIKLKTLSPLYQMKNEFNSKSNKNIKTPSCLKKKLPKIHFYKKIKYDIKSKLLDSNKTNFFITDKNNMNLSKDKFQNNKKEINKELNEKEFKFSIDSFISKFNEEYLKNGINKRNQQINKLNNLYGITSTYISKINAAKRKKYLALKDYQNNMLKAYSFNGKNSHKSVNLLSQKFFQLREEIESVAPFPKINLKTIINHIKNEHKPHKIVTVKNYVNNIFEPKDDFEREEKLIHSLIVKRNKFSKLKFKSLTSF